MGMLLMDKLHIPCSADIAPIVFRDNPLKYCGVVTDRSYHEAGGEWKVGWGIKGISHYRPRIYSDEVPMADEKHIRWLKMGKIARLRSELLSKGLYKQVMESLI